jgi:hypothetical protein
VDQWAQEEGGQASDCVANDATSLRHAPAKKKRIKMIGEKKNSDCRANDAA